MTVSDTCLDAKNRQILVTVPERWGRMDLLSQATLLAVGEVLHKASLLDNHGKVVSDLVVGLVGGTRRGSLRTDLDYIETLAEGPDFASPALFGYTLANIPLAEAAVHYRLTGPVFSLFSIDPFNEAVTVAKQWLRDPLSRCKTIVVGQFDALPGDGSDIINVDFDICYG